MCLAVPARIVSIDSTTRVAVAELVGRRRSVDLTMTPEVGVGDWVVSHSGFAVRRLTEDEAGTLTALIDDMLDRQVQTPHLASEGPTSA